MAQHRACFLVGPTAVGKTAVAHRIAGEDHAGILSADSMLVYRGMDIGTAKPDADERARVIYWGIDCADPSETFSVGSYLQRARAAVRDAAERRIPLFVVGGTGLYVKCLLEGLDEAPGAQPELRARYERVLAERGVAGLQDELRKLDAGRLERLADPKNPRRLLRALELAALGHPRKELPARVKPRLTGLRMEGGALHERICMRVRHMYESGLLDEARRLRERVQALSATAAQAIGYAEAFAALDGRMTREAAMTATILRTRQLAKRQMTWFNRQATMTWIDITPDMTVADIAATVRNRWKLDGPTPLAI